MARADGRFAEALESSAERAFAGREPGCRASSSATSPRLHLEDLALACACAAGDEEAWEHFVLEQRPLLYRAADAIDPGGGARDLADSLVRGSLRAPRARRRAAVALPLFPWPQQPDDVAARRAGAAARGPAADESPAGSAAGRGIGVTPFRLRVGRSNPIGIAIWRLIRQALERAVADLPRAIASGWPATMRRS